MLKDWYIHLLKRKMKNLFYFLEKLKNKEKIKKSLIIKKNKKNLSLNYILILKHIQQRIKNKFHI